MVTPKTHLRYIPPVILKNRLFRGAAALLATALLAALPPRRAAAEGSAEADAAIAKGIEYRRHGQDREALAEFQRAAAIHRTPRAVAQIALAEQALGLWVQAESHLQEALANDQDPWIVKNAPTFESALGYIRSHLGSVEVWGSPAGAEVLLDGQAVGKLPMEHPVRVANSEVTLQVRAKGFATITRTVQVPRGQYSVREQVDLHPVLAPEPMVVGAPPPGGAAPAEAPRVANLIAQPPATEARDESRQPLYRKTWFWVAVGAGLAAAVGAVVLVSTRGTSYPAVQSTSTFDRQ